MIRQLTAVRSIVFSSNVTRLIILVSLLIIFGISLKENFVDQTEKKFTEVRAIITTLIRSDNRSIYRTINMLHSVLRFHPSSSANRSYPFLIFHDQNFTSSMRQQILSCVHSTYPHANISFALIYFNTTIRPSRASPRGKTIGYRLMCRFWIYDIFYHPAIVQGQYDYLMRMDDDSYFSSPIPYDLFQHMFQHKLDYLYRSLYREPTEIMGMILQKYLDDVFVKTINCIYNNFFIIRLQWYYQTKGIQSFIRDLLQDNLILREYIGDGCVHGAMLKLDNKTRWRQSVTIDYGHNFHIMPASQSNWRFRVKDTFIKEINQTCG